MKQYLDRLNLIRTCGALKPQRATVDGKPIDMVSLFACPAMTFRLSDGFPILTTKNVSFRSVKLEMLWFLNGSTNNNDLTDQGVNIWSDWAEPDGELGPIYGSRWRHWPKPDGGEVDQIGRILQAIRELKDNPRASVGRRLILTAWDPAVHWDPDFSAPMACHTMTQFNVTDGELNAHMFQRSADFFLGVPYNMAGYGLLLSLMAKVTGLEPGTLYHSFGDAHVYTNHEAAIAEQLSRTPTRTPTPKLWLGEIPADLKDIDPDQIDLIDYAPQPAIKAKIAV